MSEFELAERGSALYRELSDGSVAGDALALEAARLADRLDDIDRVIRGKGVLNLLQCRLEMEAPDSGAEGYVVEVKFQNVLSEARQQALALAQIVGKLTAGESKNKKAPATKAVVHDVPSTDGAIISLTQMREKANRNRKGA